MNPGQDSLFKYSTQKTGLLILENQSLRYSSIRHFNDCLEMSFQYDSLVKEFLNEEDYSNENNLLYEYLIWKDGFTTFSPIGVLCLSATCVSSAMWGHYAEGGAGICLRFARSEPLFLVKCGLFDGGLNEIHYSKEKVDSLSSTSTRKITQLLTTKSEEWSYEQEYRCLSILDEGASHSDRRFRKSSLQSIILGPKVSLEYGEKIFFIRDSKYPHATVDLAIPCPKEYKMNIFSDIKLESFAKLQHYEFPS